MKWFRASPYPMNYCICSLEELRAWCEKTKRDMPELPSPFAGITATIGNRVFVVTMPEKNKKPWELLDTVIHESVHVYQAVLSYIGETVRGTEAEAYHIAQISTNLLREYSALHEEWKTRL